MGQEHAAALRSAAFCHALSAAELETLAAIAERRTVNPGSDLFRQGEPGDGLYVVIFGEIEIVTRTQSGERSIARLGAGEVLGEISLLTSEVRSASARALVAADVLRLPAAGFREMLQKDSPAALKLAAGIAEVLARRLAATNTKMLSLVDWLEVDRAARTDAREENLAELHRTLQVWSF